MLALPEHWSIPTRLPLGPGEEPAGLGPSPVQLPQERPPMLPGPLKEAAELAQEYYVTVDLQYSTEEWRSPILKRLGTLRGSKVFVYTLSNSSISLGRAELPSRISAITVRPFSVFGSRWTATTEHSSPFSSARHSLMVI